MKEPSKGVAHFVKAAKYSLSGLRMAVSETAVQHELVLVIVHAVLMVILPMSLQEKFLLSCLLVLVVVVEILNTAIETVVDLISPGYNPLAKRAKDLGSAAVFLLVSMYLVSFILLFILELK